MKTIVVVLVGTILVGCSGAAGGNGVDGRSGADGKDGANGKDGAPGPAGQDAAASGSRIKARWRIGEDGSREFIGWFDQQLQSRCSFGDTADGETRCLPFSAGLVQAFSDASCSVTVFVNVYQGCPIGAEFAYVPKPAGCALAPQVEIHHLGSALDSAATYYVLSGANCLVWNLGPSYDFYADGGVVDPSTFVAATIETDP